MDTEETLPRHKKQQTTGILLQLQILWQELMERFEHIEVLDEPSYTSGAFVHGYTWMPVILHPKK